VFTIGDFIVLGLVVCALVIFRRLDRNNRSLEKVKRFSDKAIEDIQAITDEKEARLRDMAIEVEVHQQAGRKIVEHLRVAEDGLAEKTQAMEELRLRMDAYNAALGELVNMTQKAEENIGRLRDESTYIDKVGRRIRAAAGQLTQIEERIPQVVAEVQAQNRSALDQAKTDITESFTVRVEELETGIKSAQQYAQEVINAIKGEVVSVQQDLSERADAYRRAFDEVEKDYHARLEAAASQGRNLETEALASLRAGYEKARSDLETAVAERDAELEARMHELSEFVRSGGQELADDLRQVRARQEAQIADLDHSMEGLVGQERSSLLAELEKNRQGILDEIAANMRDLASRQVEIGTAGESVEESLRALREKNVQTVQELEIEFKQALDAKRQEFVQDIDQGVRDLATRQVDLGAAVESVQESLQTLRAQNSEAVQGLESEFKQALETKRQEFIGDIDEGMRSLAARQADLHAAGEAVEESIAALRGRADTSIAAFGEELRKLLAANRDATLAEVEQSRRESSGFQAELQAAFTEGQDELSRRIGEVRTNVEQEVEGLAGLIEQSRVEMERMLRDSDDDHIRQAEDFRNQLRERVSTLESSIYQIEQDIEGKLLGVKDRGSQLAENLLERVSLDVDAKTDAMREAIAKRVEEVNKQVESSHEQIGRSFDELRGRVDSWVTDSKTYMTDLDDRMHRLSADSEAANIEHRATIDGHIRDTQARLDAYEQGLSSRVEGLEGFIKRAEQYVQDEFGRVEDLAKDLAAKNASTLDERWGQSRDELLSVQDGLVGELRTEMAAKHDKVVEEVNAMGEGVSNEVGLFRKELSGIHEDIVREMGSVQESLRAEIDAFRNDLASSIAEGNDRMGQIRTIEERMGASLSNWQSALEKLEAEHQTAIGAVSDRMVAKVHEQEAAQRAELERLSGTVNQTLEQERSNLNQGISQLRAELQGQEAAQHDELQSLSASVSQTIEKERQSIRDGFETLRAEAQSLRAGAFAEFQQGVQDVQAHAQTLYARIQQELDGSFGNQQERMQTLLLTVEGDIQRLQAVSQESAQKLADWDKNVREGEEHIRADILDVRERSVELASQQADAVKAEYEKRQKEVEQGLTETLGKLKSDIGHIKGDVDQDLDFLRRQIEQVKAGFQDQVRELQENAHEIEDQAIAGLKDRIESLREEARELTRKYQDDFAVSMQTIQGSIAGQMDTYQAELKRVQNSAREIQDQFRSIKEESDRHAQVLRVSLEQEQAGAAKLLAAAKDQFSAQVVSAKDAFASQIAQSQEQAMAQLKQVVDGMGGESEALKNKGERTLQDLAGQLANWQAEFNEKIKALQLDSGALRKDAMAGIQERVDSLRDEARKMTGTVKTEVVSLLDEHKGSIERFLKDAEGEYQRMADLNNATKLRFQEIQDILGKAEEAARQESELLRERTRTFAEQAKVGLQNEIQLQRDELAAGVRSAIQEIAEDAKKNGEAMKAEIIGLRDAQHNELKKTADNLAASRAELEKAVREQIDAVTRQAEALAGEGQARIDEGERLAKVADATMATLETELKNRTKTLEDSLETYGKSMADAIISKSEEREQAALADIEKRLRDYESEIGYRMGKLESVSDDMDGLESAMRQSIELLAGRIKQDLEKLGADFHKQRLGDIEQARKDFEGLRLEMLGIERSIDELKQRSYDSVSEKLKIFEDDFFADIKTRSDRMQSRFAEWQDQVQKALEGLEQQTAAERGQLETKWQALVNERLSILQQDLSHSIERVDNQVEAFTGSVGERMQNTEQNLDAFNQKVGKQVDELQQATQSLVQEQFGKLQLDIDNRLKLYEREVDSRVGKAEQDTKLRAADLQTLMETVRSDVTVWQNQILQQLKTGENMVEQDLAGLRSKTGQVVAQLRDELTQQKDEVVLASVQERTELKRDLDEVQAKIDRLHADMEYRSKEFLDLASRNQDSFADDITRKNKELADETDERVRAFRVFVGETREEFETMQRRLFGKIDDDAKVLDLNLREIDKRMKNFLQYTKLFERADTMQAELEAKVNSLRQEIEDLDAKKKELINLDPVIEKVRKLADEVNDKFSRLSAEKRRLDVMDEDYKRLSGLSQMVDQKLQQLTSANDLLTRMQLSLRQIEDTQKGVEGKLERLEKKTQIADATAEAVDRNFQSLQDLEEKVGSVNAAFEDLPARVQDVQDKITALQVSRKDADAAFKNLVNLDKIMKDVEARTEEITKAREWIARTETRMTEIHRDAQEQVQLLGSLTQKDVRPENNAGKTAGQVSTRDLVLKLARQGWKVEEIAKTTKLSRGEIELILEMGSK